MDEGMIRCDRQGCDTRLRMEKDMNFNLIRSCLGNVVKEDFFELCDRYGLMVWEEFGLNRRGHARRHRRCGWKMPGTACWRDGITPAWRSGARPTRCPARRPQEPIAAAGPEARRNAAFTLHDSTNTPPTVGDGPYETHQPAILLPLPTVSSRIGLARRIVAG